MHICKYVYLLSTFLGGSTTIAKKKKKKKNRYDIIDVLSIGSSFIGINKNATKKMVLLIISSFHDKEDKMMVIIKMSTHLKTKEMLHQKKATTSILI